MSAQAHGELVAIGRPERTWTFGIIRPAHWKMAGQSAHANGATRCQSWEAEEYECLKNSQMCLRYSINSS